MDIELRNVWYRYEGSSSWVLRNVSITLRSSEIIGVVGSNGSGKTTFMKVASLLYKPTKGDVLVNGVSFWNLNEKSKTEIRRKIVYVHEKPILLKGTVVDNVTYGLTIRGVNADKAVDIALDYLRMFRLESIANEPAHKLSLGQAQLVALIRALIVNPTMIFLDEVLANIDDEKRSIVIDLIARLRDRGIGVVISAHDNNIKLLDLDKVIVMDCGEIKEVRELRRGLY